MFSSVAGEGAPRADGNRAQNDDVPKHMNVASSCWGFMRHLCRDQEGEVGSERQ
jgi:hypothetical protein